MSWSPSLMITIQRDSECTLCHGKNLINVHFHNVTILLVSCFKLYPPLQVKSKTNNAFGVVVIKNCSVVAMCIT